MTNQLPFDDEQSLCFLLLGMMSSIFENCHMWQRLKLELVHPFFFELLLDLDFFWYKVLRVLVLWCPKA